MKKLHPKSFLSNFWGAMHFETASSFFLSVKTVLSQKRNQNDEKE